MLSYATPQWLVVRWMIYDRCYPNPKLFLQALLLCVNHGFALSCAVIANANGMCGCS